MKGNIFQTVLLVSFVVLALAGVFVLAVYKGKADPDSFVGDVIIWGTLDRKVMMGVLDAVDDELPKNYRGSITYVEFDARTYNDTLIDALAAGEGPDMILLNQGDILKQRNKIFVVPYESYSKRAFRDTYIEGAEIYTNNIGVIAFPFMLDPLIMYWNRDILTREGIANVPKYWDEFFTLSPRMTKRDSTANILLATVPFGEYQNVTNAKEIVSALVLQADNKIVESNPDTGELSVVLRSDSVANITIDPAESALRFYTEFSNPVKAVYSWNRALTESKRTFLAGDLAFYFGFASEIEGIARSNPNLNFDIAPLPQIRDDTTPLTFGHMWGAAIMKSSKNITGSFNIARLLSRDTVLTVLQEQTNLPPITRSMLSKTPSDALGPVLFESALISKAWLEPDADATDTIFKDMIESISSGRLRISNAVSEAQLELDALIK